MYVYRKGYVEYKFKDDVAYEYTGNTTDFPSKTIAPLYHPSLTDTNDTKVYTYIADRVMIITWVNMRLNNIPISFQIVASSHSAIVFNYKFQQSFPDKITAGIKANEFNVILNSYTSEELEKQLEFSASFAHLQQKIGLFNSIVTETFTFDDRSKLKFQKDFPFILPACRSKYRGGESVLFVIRDDIIITGVSNFTDTAVKCKNTLGILGIMGITTGSAIGVAAIATGFIYLFAGAGAGGTRKSQTNTDINTRGDIDREGAGDIETEMSEQWPAESFVSDFSMAELAHAIVMPEDGEFWTPAGIDQEYGDIL